MVGTILAVMLGLLFIGQGLHSSQLGEQRKRERERCVTEVEKEKGITLTSKEKKNCINERERERILQLTPEDREKERENCLNISDNAKKDCTYKSLLITNKPFDQYNTEQCIKRHKEFLQSFCAKKYTTPTSAELEKLQNEKK